MLWISFEFNENKKSSLSSAHIGLSTDSELKCEFPDLHHSFIIAQVWIRIASPTQKYLYCYFGKQYPVCEAYSMKQNQASSGMRRNERSVAKVKSFHHSTGALKK